MSNSYEHIRSLIARYSRNFIPHQPGSKVVKGHVVAVSGATGNVGSLMLDLLLKTEAVKRVYVLHRDAKGTTKSRIAKLLKEKGMNPAILDGTRIPIVYLYVDLSKPDLGLHTKDYDDLRENVTHIVHSAWHLKFTSKLDEFVHTHIAGVRHLIDLALASPQKQTPRLVFLSSIAGALNYKGPSEAPLIGEPSQYLVPEAPVDDPGMPLQYRGYGQSKFIAERIIVNSAQAGLRATISRVGQLGGMSSTGHWSKNEYGAILLRLALTLGICPSDMPAMRAIPCDIAASALVKQTFADIAGLQYFSVENPFPMQWAAVQDILVEMSPKPLNIMPFLDILSILENVQLDEKMAPAIALVGFLKELFRNASELSALGWTQSVKIAPELASCTGPVVNDMIRAHIAFQLRQIAGKEERTKVTSAKL